MMLGVLESLTSKAKVFYLSWIVYVLNYLYCPIGSQSLEQALLIWNNILSLINFSQFFRLYNTWPKLFKASYYGDIIIPQQVLITDLYHFITMILQFYYKHFVVISGGYEV